MAAHEQTTAPELYVIPQVVSRIFVATHAPRGIER
jgi:hypothetical protein